MATLITTAATPSSPTSLQLRFRRGLRGPPFPLSIRPRFRASFRLISAAGAQTPGGSWSGADASPDSFAGWSGPESVGGGDEPQKERGFGGALGVGLAGLFFVAGVGFASLSLFNRPTTGVKQHTELLKAEQEVPLNSDDWNVKVDQVSSESSAVLSDKESKIDCNLGCETDINKDSFLPELKEDDTGEELDNIHHLETSAVQHIKSIDNGVGVNNTLVPSVSDDSLPESSAYNAVESFSDASSFKDSHSTISPDTVDLVIGDNVNLGTISHVDLTSYSSDSINHTSDNQERKLSAEETVNSKVSVNSISRYGGQIPSEATPSTLVIIESSKIVDSDIKDVIEPVASVSEQHDTEPGSMPQLPAELSTSDLIVLDLIETGPSEKISGPDFDKNEDSPPIAPSLSVLSELNGSVSDIGTQSQMGRSSTFESLPERTFSHAGIPAPCLVSSTLQLPPGKVLVPAVVEQVQGQTLAALQVLKVIEADVRPGDICTRREYARWLVTASSVLSRNTISKVYPAMYIENVTELAYDDITPEDPDFSYIQGLAEAGIISSKLSRSDLNGSFSERHHDSYLFCPESPLSRQDLVSWKMAIEKRLLPEINRNDLYQFSGYIDIDKIDPNAWPALFADLFAGEQSIAALAFGYTRLFQPNKPVTKAQAAIALATGDSTEVVGEELTRIEAESLAESAVNAHTTLVADVKKDLNLKFEKELSKEREKIDAVEKLAEEARLELERLRAEREDKHNALVWGRASVESEMEVLSRLRHEAEEQLQELMSNKVQISCEKDKIDKLCKELESENQVIVQLQYELEVERKALSMARAWAEEEAKRAREQAKVLEEARDRWEKHGLKVVVHADLQDDASIGNTWLTAREHQPAVGTINRAENLLAKLRVMSAEIKVNSSNVIEKIIQKIVALISALKQWIFEASKHAKELHNMTNAKMTKSVDEFREKASELSSRASRSMEEIRDDASEFSSVVKDKARRTVEDCKGSFDKITQRFKT